MELALTEPVGSGLVAITIVVALVIMVTPHSAVGALIECSYRNRNERCIDPYIYVIYLESINL